MIVQGPEHLEGSLVGSASLYVVFILLCRSTLLRVVVRTVLIPLLLLVVLLGLLRMLCLRRLVFV